MKTGIRDQGSGISSSVAGEETLRLIALLSAPEGLEERVQADLRVAAVQAARETKILRWPVALRLAGGWMQTAPMRAAAAAAIVAVVIGGGWVVSSRLPATQPATAVSLPPRLGTSSGFSSAGAMRTPQTLDRPTVEVPAPPSPAMTPPAQPKATEKPPKKLDSQGKSVTAKKRTDQSIR